MAADISETLAAAGHEIWLCPGRKPISVPKTLKKAKGLSRKS
jgi:hypothetical protein